VSQANNGVGTLLKSLLMYKSSLTAQANQSFKHCQTSRLQPWLTSMHSACIPLKDRQRMGQRCVFRAIFRLHPQCHAC